MPICARCGASSASLIARVRSAGPVRPIGTPSSSMVPCVGGSRWLMARRQVDFPDPLGPIIATRSPADTSKDTPRRTSRAPNDFRRSCTRRSGWSVMSTSACLRKVGPLRSSGRETSSRPARIVLLTARRRPILGTIDTGTRVAGSRRKPDVARHSVFFTDRLELAVGPELGECGVHVVR